MAATTFSAALPEKQRESYLAYATTVWSRVVENGDLAEDAPNYNRIDVTAMWMLWDVRSSCFGGLFYVCCSLLREHGVRSSCICTELDNAHRLTCTHTFLPFFFLCQQTQVLGNPAIPAGASKSLHGMFLRFKDQISPSGVIPSYGDSGGP